MNDEQCGKCRHFEEKWGECEVYRMHVDFDDIRDSCMDFEEKVE